MTERRSSNGDLATQRSNSAGPRIAQPYRNPTILAIPNELLINVLEFLYHRDLIHLAISCQRFYGLAEKGLREHRRLLQQWRVVSEFGKPREWLAEQLATQLFDPRLMAYPESLRISVHNSIDLLDYTNQPMLSRATGENLRPIFDSFYWHGAWEETVGTDGDWRERLQGQESQESFILRLYMDLLPNLKSLIVDLNGRDAERIQWSFDVYPFDDAQPLATDTLTKVHINGPGFQGYQLLVCLAKIPSLRQLSASDIDVPDYEEVEPVQSLLESCVKSLTLEACELGTRPLAILLNMMPYLEHFTYTEPQSSVSLIPAIDLSHIIEVLRWSAKDCLQTLKVLDILPWSVITPLGPLEDFTVLQDLTSDLCRLPFRWEKIEGEDGLGRQVSGLPMSLLRLRVRERHSIIKFDDLMNMLYVVLGDKRHRHSKLCHIEMEGIPAYMVERLYDDPAIIILSHLGVKLTFHILSGWGELDRATIVFE